jgi:hypothetical protein
MCSPAFKSELIEADELEAEFAFVEGTRLLVVLGGDEAN